MCAPNLMRAGWLNENEHGLGIDLTGGTLTACWWAQRAAFRADRRAWARSDESPLVIRHGDCRS